MKIVSLEINIVSVLYRYRESKSRIQRDGIVAASVETTVPAAAPLLGGRDPWRIDTI